MDWMLLYPTILLSRIGQFCTDTDVDSYLLHYEEGTPHFECPLPYPANPSGMPLDFRD